MQIIKFFPSVLTLLSICIGLTSIKLALVQKWEIAVLAIVASAILDALDGKLARALYSESRFGAQLDSLADLVNFGVAPAFLMYFWQLENIKIFGWGFSMAFVLCMAIRLARFNSDCEQKNTNKYFFVGVPAPVGAILLLIPIMLFIDSGHFLDKLLCNSKFILCYTAFISSLVVSKLPTLSLKYIKIPDYLDSICMFLLAVIIAFFIIKPWIVIPLLSCLYLSSIPFTFILKRNWKVN